MSGSALSTGIPEIGNVPREEKKVLGTSLIDKPNDQERVNSSTLPIFDFGLRLEFDPLLDFISPAFLILIPSYFVTRLWTLSVSRRRDSHQQQQTSLCATDYSRIPLAQPSISQQLCPPVQSPDRPRSTTSTTHTEDGH